ncbi:MAG TPA: hypothetical protein PL001_02260, partial [Candidatus Kryptobacter bacterium]|nr:hypothetical protein [Candidatus Kryptobacter bacterium]
MRVFSAFLIVSITASFAVAPAYGQIGLPSSSPVPGPKKYWIFFRDKPNALEAGGVSNQEAAEQFLVQNGVLSRRAIERREKVLPASRIVSISDFPVCEAYLDSIRSVGLDVIGTSRWFNAAVVTADSTALSNVEKLPFVVGIKR